jgi:hypothetical protein
MAQREVRDFDYVNHPYEPVRDLLLKEAPRIFAGASRVAETRAGEIVASLSVDLKGIQISKDITIRVRSFQERPGLKLTHVLHVELEWEAKESPALFPVMKADLSLYPLSATETQVDLTGHYEPPLGPLGGVIDAALGHRLAEASVHRFLAEVVERLRRETPGK